MGLFSKEDPAKVLDRLMLEYKELMNDKDYLLSYVFRFHENNGEDYIYKENTDRRNVYLLRNRNRIALRKLDDESNVLLNVEREINWKVDNQLKIVQIINDLYINELS